MVRAIAIVTGANSGVGYAICQRLMLQLSVPNPPDCSPQPLVHRDETSESYSPSSPFDSLTIILACRNKQRGLEARDNLLTFIDVELLKRKRDRRRHSSADNDTLTAYEDVFRKGLVVDFIPCDLASVSSVLTFCETVQRNYPYITHLFCNAGLGAFLGLNWFRLAYEFATNFLRALILPKFKLQQAGVLSDDGLGWVWQCNVFGHYLMARNLKQTLRSSPPIVHPSRVIWTSTLDTCPESFDRTLDDWQLVKSEVSYEHSKFETELIAIRLNEAYRTPTATDDSVGTGTAIAPEIRHFVTHPGVPHTQVFAVLGNFLNWIASFAFILARWLGSVHNHVDAIVGAASAVHVALAPTSYLHPADAPITYGSQTDFWARSRVSAYECEPWGGPGGTGAGPVNLTPDEKEEMARIADSLIVKCDALCEAWEIKEGKGVAGAPTVDKP